MFALSKKVTFKFLFDSFFFSMSPLTKYLQNTNFFFPLLLFCSLQSLFSTKKRERSELKGGGGAREEETGR